MTNLENEVPRNYKALVAEHYNRLSDEERQIFVDLCVKFNETVGGYYTPDKAEEKFEDFTFVDQGTFAWSAKEILTVINFNIL